MVYKKVRKKVTLKELGVCGDTAGDFLLNLQRRLPVSPLDTMLPNGMKLSIGTEKMEIKFPKNKEIRSDIIEEILTEGTRLLLEENRRRDHWPGYLTTRRRSIPRHGYPSIELEAEKDETDYCICKT